MVGSGEGERVAQAVAAPGPTQWSFGGKVDGSWPEEIEDAFDTAIGEECQGDVRVGGHGDTGKLAWVDAAYFMPH